MYVPKLSDVVRGMLLAWRNLPATLVWIYGTAEGWGILLAVLLFPFLVPLAPLLMLEIMRRNKAMTTLVRIENPRSSKHDIVIHIVACGVREPVRTVVLKAGESATEYIYKYQSLSVEEVPNK